MNKNTILTVDLGFGDSGKGSIVDFLVRERGAHTVVRFSGGAQAGHRVVTAEPKPREHVFSQFGAGTLAGAKTHLSRFMMIEPFAMQAEAEHLQAIGVANPFSLMTIDENCLVTTPFHRAVNRLKEVARGNGRHGSCGMGVGETMADFVTHGERVLFAKDFFNAQTLYEKLAFLKEANQQKLDQLVLPDNEIVVEETAVFTAPDTIDWLIAEYQTFARKVEFVTGRFLAGLLVRGGTAVFEASQGVLLDEWYGFHPYTTWSTTTLANAEMLLQESGYDGSVERVGITRAYATRHGAGPFVTEQPELAHQLPDAVNGFDQWQEGFRVGWLDLATLRYAKAVAGKLDYLAVCHLDRLAEVDALHICDHYLHEDNALRTLPIKADLTDLAHQERLTNLLFAAKAVLQPVGSPQALLQRISDALALPVGIESWGETAVDKTFT